MKNVACLPERMMAWGYPVSDCCRTASWTTLFSWGAKGTALVLVKVNGFLTSVYGLIQTSMGPTFVWNAFRLSTRPIVGSSTKRLDTRRSRYSPRQGRCEMRLLFPSLSSRVAFCIVIAYRTRGLWMPRCRVLCNQPSGKINRSSILLSLIIPSWY